MTSTISTQEGLKQKSLSTYPSELQDAVRNLELAMPTPGYGLEQDEEWVVVHTGGKWRKVRLHDSNDVFAIPGLYEKWVYEILECTSPRKVRQLLHKALKTAKVDPKTLNVLDLGAGNGCVAEELRHMGARNFIGVDIFEEAAAAAERDRPGLYREFVVGDLTDSDSPAIRILDESSFNCLTCVAALGFGDIPPEVFAAAFNRIDDEGWVAFTIKTDFIDDRDKSGFSALIRRMMAENVLELAERESYTHRISTEGDQLQYDAFIGRKRSAIPDGWIETPIERM